MLPLAGAGMAFDTHLDPDFLCCQVVAHTCRSNELARTVLNRLCDTLP